MKIYEGRTSNRQRAAANILASGNPLSVVLLADYRVV